jgi:hypothetical protein
MKPQVMPLAPDTIDALKLVSYLSHEKRLEHCLPGPYRHLEEPIYPQKDPNIRQRMHWKRRVKEVGLKAKLEVRVPYWDQRWFQHFAAQQMPPMTCKTEDYYHYLLL